MPKNIMKFIKRSLKNKIKFNMNIKKTNFLSMYNICLGFIFIALLSSCNEQPTELGFKLDSLEVNAISSLELPMLLNNIESYKSDYYTALNSRAFVGKSHDIEAKTIIRFPKFPENFSYDELISAKIRFAPTRYKLGNEDTSSNSYHLNFHEINNQRLDSVLPYSTINTAGFFKDELFSSFNDEVMFEDKASVQLEIDFPEEKLQEWITNSEQLYTWRQEVIAEFQEKDSTITEIEADNIVTERFDEPWYWHSLGIVEGESMNFITSFFGHNQILSDDDGNPSDTVNSFELEIVFKKDTVEADTISLQAQVRYFSEDFSSLIDDGTRMYVQSGAPIRSQFDFDLSQIPDFSGFVRSEIHLHIDEENTRFGNMGADSIVHIRMLEDKDKAFAIEDDNLIVIGERASQDTSLYVIPTLNNVFESILSGDKTGSAYLMYAPGGSVSGEKSTMNRYVFHGPNSADVDKRPKLTIFYLKRPKL